MTAETDQSRLDPTRVLGEPGDAGVDGGINQGQDDAALTPEQAAEVARRRALGNAIDNNAASHQGGMGAQSGQADFGSAGNTAGMRD